MLLSTQYIMYMSTQYIMLLSTQYIMFMSTYITFLFEMSIEEKDYRDVSKVVLPLLYPSMFTVTYEECIV